MDAEMNRLEFNHFMIDVAAFNPSKIAVDKCIKHLVSKHALIELSNGGYQWQAFHDRPSIVSQRGVDGVRHPTPLHEVAVFGGMGKICEVIETFKYPRGHSEPQRRVTCEDPNRASHSEVPGATHKLDAHWELVDHRSDEIAGEDRHTANMAAVASYKLRNTDKDVYDNRMQNLSAAVHSMNNDPIRTHSYSITIEDKWMKLWYWSRSHSVMSTSIVFADETMGKDDVARVVSALLSIMFATQEELGYDPCITRGRGEDNKIFYIFRLKDPSGRRDRYYRSHRSIFELISTSVTGRATRVWEVQEIISKNKHAFKPRAPRKVLKDVWLDDSVEVESSIQKQIFDDLENVVKSYSDPPTARDGRGSPHGRFNREKFIQFPPPSLVDAVQQKESLVELCDDLEDEKYKKYFMTISADRRDGPTTRLLHSEARPERGIVAKKLSQKKNETLPSIRSEGTAESTAAVAASISAARPLVRRPFRVRRRYWVLYDEVCVTLGDLNDFKTVFAAMQGGLKALRLLALADWIHRDISDGNILAFIDEGTVQGKLSDLEYALKRSNERVASGDPKTGTPAYMAVEIQDNEAFGELTETTNIKPDSTVLVAANARRSPSPPTSFEHQATHQGPEADTDRITVGVVHTIYHDVESFLWLALRFVSGRINHQASLEMAEEVFRHQTPSPRLKRMLLKKANFMGHHLSKTLHPTLAFLSETFNHLRLALTMQYLDPSLKNTMPDAPFRLASLLIRGILKVFSRPGAPEMLARSEVPDLFVSVTQDDQDLERSDGDDGDDPVQRRPVAKRPDASKVRRRMEDKDVSSHRSSQDAAEGASSSHRTRSSMDSKAKGHGSTQSRSRSKKGRRSQ